MRISTSFLSISSSVVRERLQNTPDSAIPLAVNIITSSFLLIGPSTIINCNIYHLGKEPGRVRSPLWGTPSHLVCHLIWISLGTISNHVPGGCQSTMCHLNYSRKHNGYCYIRCFILSSSVLSSILKTTFQQPINIYKMYFPT